MVLDLVPLVTFYFADALTFCWVVSVHLVLNLLLALPALPPLRLIGAFALQVAAGGVICWVPLSLSRIFYRPYGLAIQ